MEKFPPNKEIATEVPGKVARPTASRLIASLGQQKWPRKLMLSCKQMKGEILSPGGPRQQLKDRFLR